MHSVHIHTSTGLLERSSFYNGTTTAQSESTHKQHCHVSQEAKWRSITLDGRITLSLWSLPSEQGKCSWKLCQFKANYYHNFRFEPWGLISPCFNKRFLVQQTLQISVLSLMSLHEQGKLCISSGIRERWIIPTKSCKISGFHTGGAEVKIPWHIMLCRLVYIYRCFEDHSGFLCSFRQPKKFVQVVEEKLLDCLTLKVNAGNTIFRDVSQYLPACTA